MLQEVITAQRSCHSALKILYKKYTNILTDTEKKIKIKPYENLLKQLEMTWLKPGIYKRNLNQRKGRTTKPLIKSIPKCSLSNPQNPTGTLNNTFFQHWT